jgi:hypothetical protein
MNTSTLEPLATSVTFDSENMWVHLSDGRQLGVPLAYFPRLAKASPEQLTNYLISGGVGLHWDEIDEDISVPALLAGRMDQTARPNDPVKQAA